MSVTNAACKYAWYINIYQLKVATYKYYRDFSDLYLLMPEELVETETEDDGLEEAAVEVEAVWMELEVDVLASRRL